jgi:hypothetical protein
MVRTQSCPAYARILSQLREPFATRLDRDKETPALYCKNESERPFAATYVNSSQYPQRHNEKLATLGFGRIKIPQLYFIQVVVDPGMNQGRASVPHPEACLRLRQGEVQRHPQEPSPAQGEFRPDESLSAPQTAGSARGVVCQRPESGLAGHQINPQKRCLRQSLVENTLPNQPSFVQTANQAAEQSFPKSQPSSPASLASAARSNWIRS